MQQLTLSFFKLLTTMFLGGFATIQTLMMLPAIKYFNAGDIRLTIGYGVISVVMIILTVKIIRKILI